MDGDSGDEGNDELTCVRSDESDKSSKYLQQKHINRHTITLATRE